MAPLTEQTLLWRPFLRTAPRYHAAAFFKELSICTKFQLPQAACASLGIAASGKCESGNVFSTDRRALPNPPGRIHPGAAKNAVPAAPPPGIGKSPKIQAGMKGRGWNWPG